MSAIETNSRILSFTDNRLSFTCRESGSGWRDIAIGIKANRDVPLLEYLESSEVRCDGNMMTVRGVYPSSRLEETLMLSVQEDGSLQMERCIANPDPVCITLQESFLAKCEPAAGPVLSQARCHNIQVYHMDNLRLERYPWCRLEGPALQPLPAAPQWYGDQENVPLPVMCLTTSDDVETLVDGQLAQRMARACWQLEANPSDELCGTWRIDYRFLGGGPLLQEGQSVALDPHFFDIRKNVPVQESMTHYFTATTHHNKFLAPQSSLLDTAFYCSWNYGIKGNISEESLLKTARAVKENLPEVTFFLMDDGWQGKEPVDSANCANFYLPEEQWIQNEKFPSGMKAYADAVREIGLRPAIWWTPSVCLSSTLAKEHPEWLARDNNGEVFRINRSGYLDLAREEVRNYLMKIWDILFHQWGFEAVKLDFLSHAFECENLRYSQGTHLQWRKWFLTTLRSYLPDDGFIMTCVAGTQGNIFVGELAECYRCCIDVNEATWVKHLDACCWVQPLLSIPGRDTFLMNADGFGVKQDAPENETIHRLTYGFISMGTLEVDGRIEELNERQMDWLRRLTTNVDRGYAVRCPERDPYSGEPFPRVLYVDYPEDSPTYKRGVRKHIALFNWRDDAQYIGTNAEKIGLKAGMRLRDFWTDEESVFNGEGMCEYLAGRSARLYEVRDASE